MNTVRVISALALAGAVLLSAACTPSTKGGEAAIQDMNKKWLELVAKKDAAGIAQIYADDGAIMPPGSPKAVGHDAIQATWSGLFQIPGMDLTFATERLVMSKSGDMAADIGTYDLKMGEGADHGKYVVVWVKRAGKWEVLSDMFSGDAPAPAGTTPPAP
jgi:uncharacterized protein (TIGR02246 family)